MTEKRQGRLLRTCGKASEQIECGCRLVVRLDHSERIGHSSRVSELCTIDDIPPTD